MPSASNGSKAMNIGSRLDEFALSSATLCSEAPESMMKTICQIDVIEDMEGNKRVLDPS